MSVKLQYEGRRIYFVGNTYPIKDKIKSMGGHWDSDRKMWWIGSQAKGDAQKLVESSESSDAYVPIPITEKSRVYRKVRYVGKSGKPSTFYVVAESRSGKFRLTTLDRSIDFWADANACETLKVYRPRELWNGRRGGGTVEVYTTLGGIADFIAESKAADKEIAAGHIPDGYCVDLEDGVVKRRSECDIPADEAGVY